MTKVITGKVRLSYANVFHAKAINDGEAKYSTAVLIPKEDKATLKKIKDAVEEAKKAGKDSKWGGKIPANAKMPLRDGDEEFPEDEAYAGHYFLNATNKTKPGIAKPVGKDANGKTKFQEITDETEVYSGCYCKLSLNFFPFNANGNKGVAVGLNHIVKVQDGEPLGGGASLEADFDGEDFEIEIDDEEDYLS
ncbi:Gp2.5-like ssDNA binding protein and ssDNA annealing protein [Bacillus phage Wes44]|uniref:DUF2815 family protein n=1 Tax=Bacillus phage Wes44 TaxID=2283012 RepID=A0A346FK33_9CAUD|nr:Gp2.5-like ssDNA binding protein and ssDNA annealing protein [Bacillus phage Wes44]AXN58338.1 hypothetical protein Wes44_29 [Bacillus phage Wes44]